jgi:hypothetical protein
VGDEPKEGYELLAKSVQALTSALGLAQETLRAVEQVYTTQQQTVATVKDFVFGRDDPSTLKHYPGLNDRVRFDGYMIRAGLALIGVVALHSLGVPTELIGKAILSHFGINLGPTPP